VALELKKIGITRVRPLEGGYEGWRDRGYPTEPARRVPDVPVL
jgi:rhodanese-related sulfurtransferase